MTNQLQTILSVLLSAGMILAGIARVLQRLGQFARSHDELVRQVAGLVDDGPKMRRRMRRVERELGLRPRTRTTSTAVITQTTEREPTP